MDQYHYIYKLELVDESGVEIHNYFGKRSCSNIPEQDICYMGSPVTAKEIIENWPKHLKKKLILQHYNDCISLGIAEEKIIRENMHDKPKNLNYAISAKNYYLTPEQRSEIAKKARQKQLDTFTPEQRSDITKKGNETKGPERLSSIAKKRMETLGPKRRSEAVRKGNITRKLNKMKNSGNYTFDI